MYNSTCVKDRRIKQSTALQDHCSDTTPFLNQP